jgi:beta-galactosidase
MCNPFWKVVHVSDVVAYNLYLGWYVPGLKLNDLFMDFFHWKWPKRCLGYSEYGAEGMPNLHSAKPRRGDHSEEYQAIYHEYMMECFERHPFLWGTYVWNMFDFAADARDQGGEPGMNHKGLITFDRQTKKDSFYLYKAWWSDEPFVHITGKRRQLREEGTTTIKVYSNQPKVALYVNGKPVGEKTGKKVFTFQIPLSVTVNVEAKAGKLTDTASFTKVDAPHPDYKLQKSKSKSANWV